MSDSLQTHGFLQARILEWIAFSLLEEIFPIQGSNPGLLHCRWILYQMSHKGSPRILEWVAYHFSWGSSQLQELNQGLLHCRWILYQLRYEGSPKFKEGRNMICPGLASILRCVLEIIGLLFSLLIPFLFRSSSFPAEEIHSHSFCDRSLNAAWPLLRNDKCACLWEAYTEYWGLFCLQQGHMLSLLSCLGRSEHLSWNRFNQDFILAKVDWFFILCQILKAPLNAEYFYIKI